MLVSNETMPRDLDDGALPRPERYEILRKIGAGSQAEVLLGTARGERGFRRRVAIKRVPSDLEHAARQVADLIQEAQLIARLSHPNVVSALDVDQDNAGRPFLVMEYIDGVTLGKLVESGPVPHPIASFIVRELLSGLGYIHESRNRARGRGRGRRGLVHRDVSPDNVLLSWEGEVKLADFGVAQVLESTMTAPAIVAVGKPGYMSPEQVNRQALDGRSDLYAVGIVLWELLARRRLSVGSVHGIPTSSLLRDIPRPSEIRQGVPADLEAVAMRLVAHDRGERYQTAGLAAHDLMRCHAIPRDGRAELARLLDERSPRAGRHHPNSQPPAFGTPSDAARTVTAPSVPMGAPPWPWIQADVQRRVGMLRRQRRRALAWSVMIALLVAAAVALHMVTTRDGTVAGSITTEGTGE